jgi:hypothetical protein
MPATWYNNPSPITRRVRAYFAPVTRSTQIPELFDPSIQGGFPLDSPPSSWISLGWIQNFMRKTLSKSTALLTGIPASPLEQARETLQAQVSFEYLSWTKLTMALATGSQHMNILAPAGGTSLSADGSTALPAVTPQAGSTSTSILLASSDLSSYSVGSIIAVDVDYSGETGYVGFPVSGAYIKSSLSDVDYVRRVTYNVGLVSAMSSIGLTLAEALPGGTPVSGAKVQRVLGFVDREGGSFYQEWSALFVVEGSQGERIFYHYPRLQAVTGAEEELVPIDGKTKGGLSRVHLKGQYLALPITDPLDGERVVCYRSMLPAANAMV